MDINIWIPVITALIGGILAGVPSYVSYRAKKIELEHTYTKSIEDKMHDLALAHVDTVYKPIYSFIINLENKIKSDKITLELLTKSLKQCETITSNEEMIYLVNSVEVDLIELLRLMKRSIDCKKYIIGTKMQSTFFNIQFNTYHEKEYESKRKLSLIMLVDRLIESSSSLFLSSIISTKSSFYYKAAPINSKEFENEIINYTTNIRNNIKLIVLKTPL